MLASSKIKPWKFFIKLDYFEKSFYIDIISSKIKFLYAASLNMEKIKKTTTTTITTAATITTATKIN